MVLVWSTGLFAEQNAAIAAGRKQYKTYDGGGGREWVKVNAEKVIADLTRAWGRDPDRKSEV
jgi:hypothetical protein